MVGGRRFIFKISTEVVSMSVTIGKVGKYVYYSPAEVVTGNEPYGGMEEPVLLAPGRPMECFEAKRPAVKLDGC